MFTRRGTFAAAWRGRQAIAGTQRRRSVAAASVVALIGIVVALSGLPRSVQAAAGGSTGRVFGTGSIDVGGVLQTVSLDLSIDVSISAAPSGSFSIDDGSTSAAGEPTCLFISGSTAVIGVYLPGSNIWGLLAITDNPSGLDTLWLDAPTSVGPVDCTTSPPPGTDLVSGDFTVSTGPLPSAGPSAGPSSVPPPSSGPSADPSSVPPPADANLDGIVDTLQPSGTPALSFLDDSLTPPTYGSIVSTAGLSVSIADAPDPLDGVEITVGPGTPGTQVELSVCGGFTVLLDAGSTTTGTCHSVLLEVTTGSAQVVLGGGTTVVSIPAGGAAEVTDLGDGSYAVENTGTPGSPSISLTVDGTTVAVSAGTTSTAETWDFVGFSQPVDNAPTLNRVKAGQAVPVKWRVLNSVGAPIIDLTTASLAVTTLDCAVGTTIDQIEELSAGSTGLLNLGNGSYQLNWKTPTSYAGTCKTLHLDISDGVVHDALFQFTR